MTAFTAQDGTSRLFSGLTLALLLGTILVAGAAQGAYAAAGVSSARFDVAVRLALFASLWNWTVAQLGLRRLTGVPDLGVFMAVLWFILLPYYLWQDQRWRGLAKVGIICAAHALAYVLTLAVYFAAR